MSNKTTKIEYLSNREDVSMGDDWFDIVTEDHFWMQWRFSILKKMKKHLPSKEGKILEIGCGNGVVLNQLSKIGYSVDGCDLNEHALKMVDHNDGKVMLYNIYDKDPVLKGQYDTILLLDVIEHIDDDADFLKTALYYLKEGGKIFVNVPAGNYLYGRYDEEVGHVRRYDKSMMRTAFKKAGIIPVKTSYWAMSLIPLALIRKVLQRNMKKEDVINNGMKPPGKLVHSILKMVKNIELTIFRFPPIGASLFAIGQKK